MVAEEDDLHRGRVVLLLIRLQGHPSIDYLRAGRRFPGVPVVSEVLSGVQNRIVCRLPCLSIRAMIEVGKETKERRLFSFSFRSENDVSILKQQV